MEKFEFSSTSSGAEQDITPFSGQLFYGVYKDAEFLRHSDNIETILSKGYELRQRLKSVAPGQSIMINGICLEKNTPLLIKKTGPKIDVENYEFTANRLSGLVAAYAFDNHYRFPVMKSSEALALGLKWNNLNKDCCRLYLSAVSGTEHFYDQFSYWPLICALRKLQMKKITLEPVIKMAKIKNCYGVRMGKDLMNNICTVQRLWLSFPGTSNVDFKSTMKHVPVQLMSIFKGN